MWKRIGDRAVFTHLKHPGYSIVLSPVGVSFDGVFVFETATALIPLDSKFGKTEKEALEGLCLHANSLHTLPEEAEFLDQAFKAFEG